MVRPAADAAGVVKAIWISVGCRIMIGVVAGWLFILLKKWKVNSWIALPVTGFVGSMTNTVFVMGSIYLLLARQYAEAKNVAVSAVWDVVLGATAVRSLLSDTDQVCLMQTRLNGIRAKISHFISASLRNLKKRHYRLMTSSSPGPMRKKTSLFS